MTVVMCVYLYVCKHATVVNVCALSVWTHVRVSVCTRVTISGLCTCV